MPTTWRSGTYPAVTAVNTGDGRMAPWTVTDGTAELVRGTAGSMGGLGRVGTHLAVAPETSLERTIAALDPGREYRISLRYARDSRTAGSADAVTALSIGDLQYSIIATTATPSASGSGQITFGTYVGTFTAEQRTEKLTLEGVGAAGMMIDDLVIIGADPGIEDALVHYRFDEGTGSTAANSGTRASAGAASLSGDVGWSDDAVFGKSLAFPGGDDDFVTLPNGVLQGVTDFSVSMWTKLDERKDWTGLFQVGEGTGETGGYFQIQSNTRVTPVVRDWPPRSRTRVRCPRAVRWSRSGSSLAGRPTCPSDRGRTSPSHVRVTPERCT
ncbi:hypothetical protein [Microbacterium sp. NIBRBAC000506063]|uniref:hypothetical protein n=1 Tax=Microbacterium sp. NIBRBAC000506063 TaxID=2734618 RepID=UPI001BB4CBBA|nr:hypothetical protein [Microbacterium sp. NIBRBAC000506063]QTV80398.1 hypothetical protein KAE78_05560 [Microbacterium sp. NIBRBAC000506063]